MQCEALSDESGGIFLNIGSQDVFSKFILLLPSYIKSSLKLRGPVPETAVHVTAMSPLPPCFTDEAVCLGSFAVPFFLLGFPVVGGTNAQMAISLAGAHLLSSLF